MAIRATVIGEEVEHEGGGTVFVLDREEAETYFADMLGTLLQTGGQLNVTAERVQIGSLGDEPLMHTQRLFCFYNTSAPASKPSPQED